MSQTDRQTDKATHWKSAIFDSGEGFTGQWALLDTLPPFVKTVHKQEEICPETQRHHFQVHVVCNRQVRLTQLTGWIKHTKWFAVLGEQHIKNSINYTSKKESAVPGTHQVVQGEKYFQLHEIMETLARYAEPVTSVKDQLDIYPDCMNGWKWITRRLIIQDRTWANRLSNPTLRRMWNDWGSLFIQNWEEAGSFIIEDPVPENEVEGEDCLIE